MEKRLKKKGMQQGVQQGALDLLLDQLETKFGSLSSDLRTRLEHADINQIRQWSRKILSAEKLSDIFSN